MTSCKDIPVQGEQAAIRVAQTLDERVNAVLNWLRPLAAPVAAEAEFARWISARHADTEQSESWCTACATAEVERLNSTHPEHEYLVDGGWGSETDTPRYCCKCGKTLSDHLTSYGIKYEVDHYSRYTVGLRGKHAAEKAFRFMEVFESASFDAKDSDTWRFFRKVERMHERRKNSEAGGAIPHGEASGQ